MALVKAKFIVEKTNQSIPVHFNPSEYSIDVTPFAPADDGDGSVQNPIGIRATESLSLKLHFDTYTKYQELLNPAVYTIPVICEDVRYYTQEIAKLAAQEDPDDPCNKTVSFVWGSLNFSGFVASVNQRFTMFLDDGKPVRAEVSVKMNKKSALNDVFQGTGTRVLPDLTDESWKAAVAGIVQAGKLRDLLEVI